MTEDSKKPGALGFSRSHTCTNKYTSSRYNTRASHHESRPFAENELSRKQGEVQTKMDQILEEMDLHMKWATQMVPTSNKEIEFFKTILYWLSELKTLTRRANNFDDWNKQLI